MNKTEKFLKKLSIQERQSIEQIVKLITLKNFDGLDIKKLKGASNLFRVRKGKIRIVYGINTLGTVIILSVDRRNDTTYNF